jgi:hypothetical protein
MRDVLTSVDELIERWRRERVRLLPPLDEREVVDMLQRVGRPFARDLVRLYCATGGMEDGEMDGECLTLWTPERLVEENSKHMRPQVLFMDFLINSHFYGLQREDADTSSVYVDYSDDAPPRRLADSLDEFFRLYLNDSLKIFR